MIDISIFNIEIPLAKLKIALLNLGLYENINNYINQSGDTYTKIWWEYGNYVDFSSDKMLHLKDTLNIDDNLYIKIYYECLAI